jgi:hypothetical protein
MSRGGDGSVRDSVNGCSDETVYANFHLFLIAGSERGRAAARAR